jgi:hypothetical protein
MKALIPETIEEEKPAREPKKARGAKRGRKQEDVVEMDETPKEPELTAMQIAWQMAMERSNSRDKSLKIKPVKSASNEQADILNRTLEKQLPTGG